MKTRDVRPWWWWINPWLYIKRRDIAYDVALDSLYEACRVARFPNATANRFDSTSTAELVSIAGMCSSCGKKYIQSTRLVNCEGGARAKDQH